MKIFLTLLLALALLAVESVFVKYVGFEVTRIDVTVALVAFLALRASTIQGAFCSFGIGYMLDLMSGRPTGLYTFLAMLTFLVGRLAGSLVDVRSRTTFALFALGADVGHTLLGSFFIWMTSRGASGLSGLTAIPVQAVLTALVAFLLHPLLQKLDTGDERTQSSLLG
jgi:hypothetical protein